MLADLARAVRLSLLRHCWPVSLFGSMVVILGTAQWTEARSGTSSDGRVLGVPSSQLLEALVLLGTLTGLLVFWAWVWRALGPRLDAGFDEARRGLGGSPLSESTRSRLRRELDRVLPRPGQVGSVLRAFRARVSGADLIVAEWSPNGQGDALVLAEAELVVVLADCDAELPAFHLEPETLVTRCSEWMHGRLAPAATRRVSEDVDFKRDPEWSGRWFLCGPRRAALRTLFRRKVRDVFRRVRGWRASGRGRWLVLRTPRAVAGSNLAERVREAAGLAVRFQRAASTA